MHACYNMLMANVRNVKSRQHVSSVVSIVSHFIEIVM